MKKGEIYTGTVEKLDFPDKGVITIEKEKVIVRHVLPGQTVEIMITKRRKDKCEGRLMRVLKRSEHELAAPQCVHAPECGGCSYQTLPYEEQLKLKESQVKALLDRAITEEYEFEGIKASPLVFEYRNKMEFTFGDEVKDGPLALGMHKRGSFYDIVTVEHCRLIHSDFRKILTETLHYFSENGTPFLKKMQHTGYLRHLLVRRAAKTGDLLVDLITTTQTDGGRIGGREESELLDGWKKRLLALTLEGCFAGILHTKNDSLADVVQNEGTDILYGQDFIYEELLGLRFKITPFSFFQTNSPGAEVLYDTVRRYIGDTRGANIFDLYSGTGTIAQILAPVASHVTGVEIVAEAVEAARENAARNGLANCEFIAGDVLKVIDGLKTRPDLMVLDPPRDGIHPKALPKIAAPDTGLGAERIVYVSCKPTSLARDLVVLKEYGYRVVRACCVDMFVGTCHVETVVLMSRKEK